MTEGAELLSGLLHVFVAFDWGDEIALDKVARLVPASVLALPRRRRTPSSISYHPAPLRIALDPVELLLEDGAGSVRAAADVTLFDFGAVSLAFHVRLDLTPD